MIAAVEAAAEVAAEEAAAAALASPSSTPAKSTPGSERAMRTSKDRLLPPAHPEYWATSPMLLRNACGTTLGEEVQCNVLDSVFPIETELFSGHGYIRLKGVLPNCDKADAYFQGKKRKMSTTIQGRVKRPLVMTECSTGFEFMHPLLHLPARKMLQMIETVVRAIAPAVSIDLLGARPSILNPLFNAVQRLHVSLPGEEPDITAAVEEKTTLLGGVFAEKPLSWKRRKIFFSTPSAVSSAYSLDPAYVYTMELYEDKLNPSTFDLLVGPWKFPLARFLGGGTSNPQTIGTMGKLGFTPHSQQYLFNVELWHETLFGASVPEMPAFWGAKAAAAPAADPPRLSALTAAGLPVSLREPKHHRSYSAGSNASHTRSDSDGSEIGRMVSSLAARTIDENGAESDASAAPAPEVAAVALEAVRGAGVEAAELVRALANTTATAPAAVGRQPSRRASVRWDYGAWEEEEEAYATPTKPTRPTTSTAAARPTADVPLLGAASAGRYAGAARAAHASATTRTLRKDRVLLALLLLAVVLVACAVLLRAVWPPSALDAALDECPPAGAPPGLHRRLLPLWRRAVGALTGR